MELNFETLPAEDRLRYISELISCPGWELYSTWVVEQVRLGDEFRRNCNSDTLARSQGETSGYVRCLETPFEWLEQAEKEITESGE